MTFIHSTGGMILNHLFRGLTLALSLAAAGLSAAARDMNVEANSLKQIIELLSEPALPPLVNYREARFHAPPIVAVAAKLTAYHSSWCSLGDTQRGRTMTGASACNESGVAADHALLPVGTIVYIDDSKLPKKKRWRVVDDGCKFCSQQATDGIYHIDVRVLSRDTALRFGASENALVLAFKAPKS